MIDRHQLLATLKPLVTQLEQSIRERTLATPEVAAHLRQEHHKAVAAGRTAMSLEEWRDDEITQAAVAWVLGCVFVRFLEDNALIDQALISGPGERRAAALGYREEHFRAHPEHSDREYLEACFRTVASFPAVAPLYDQRHNPLWRLAPTADGARQLREAFTAIEPNSGLLAHDFADPELGTRFLGDLYQDLSESAKRRYALLQTPDFVERFILARTLTPAITEFGLDDVRLIDPTCGSGHFLVDAFGRLFDLWTEREPGTNSSVLAQRALDQIAGVDLNPFATAIARFRLMVAALQVCGIRRLAEAPAFKLHLATGDSLLHGPLPADGAGMLFDANRLNKNIAHVYESEDAGELREILGRGYHAVVGNPPYITGSDDALREAYRARYRSCHREFALTVPFMERFFELAQVNSEKSESAVPGYVGKITGNNFLRREFGKPLVESFLPAVDVQVLVDASDAHIPGHATPTVLVFARSRPAQGSTVRVVECLRGEGETPRDPAKGLVWSAITEQIDVVGESEFVRVVDLDRTELWKHPVRLGPGRTLASNLERSLPRRLRELVDDVGYTGQTNIDDLMLRPARAWHAVGVKPAFLVGFATGEAVRDWLVEPELCAWFPYQESGLLSVEDLGANLNALWPWRELAWSRRTFNKQSYKAEGRPWYEWHQVALRRHVEPLTITWAFIATHNHFALDRGGTVFNRSAPLLKLRTGTSVDDHLKLLGYLNSAIACFWLKQTCHDKGVGGIGGGIGDEPWEPRFEFNGSNVERIPVPKGRTPRVASCCKTHWRSASGSPRCDCVARWPR